MSSYNADNVFLNGPIFFRQMGTVAPIEPDGDGILEVCSCHGSSVIVKNGSIVKGIKLLERDHVTPYVITDDDLMVMIMLSAEDGGLVTFLHEDAGILEPTYRVNVEDGAFTVVDAKTVQIFWRVISNGTRRWRVHDWAGI